MNFPSGLITTSLLPAVEHKQGVELGSFCLIYSILTGRSQKLSQVCSSLQMDRSQ